MYNGQLDIIVNSGGQDKYVHTLEWVSSDNWRNSDKKPYIEGGEVVGNYKTYNGFTYINVYGHGHMLPHENPFLA